MDLESTEDTTFHSEAPVGDELDSAIAEVSRPAAEQPATDSAVSKPAEPAAQKFKYVARGKEVEEPLDVILKRASMGYDYAQNQEQLKAQTAEWQAKLAAAQEMEARWKPFDEYARQNPEWRELVERSWQERMANTAPNGTVMDPADPVVSKLSAIEQKLGAIDQFVQTQQQRELDAALDGEVKSIREKYSYLDLTTPDPSTGKSLELQVLEHARNNGINSFKTAFNDFYHDRIVEMEKLRAKEELGKEIAKAKKAGFIGVTPTPTKAGISQAQGIKNKSYDDLMNEGLAEFGIA